MVTITKNPNGDSRTAPKDIKFEEFKKANRMHIEDVKNTMNELSYELMTKGKEHDFTKILYEELFYDNFISTMNKGTDFINDEWYKKHVATERHHLLSKCPNDVNLLDVLEMIVDCVCAGKSRSGEVRPVEINDKILKDAFNNTVKLIDRMIVCKE